MIFPDLVQLYQFHYFFRLNCYFLPLPRLLFIAIVAFMPKLLVIYMNMMSVGSLPGCDEASKIFQGILGTIIGCRRQLSIYLVIMPHFIFSLTFWGVFYWWCLSFYGNCIEFDFFVSGCYRLALIILDISLYYAIFGSISVIGAFIAWTVSVGLFGRCWDYGWSPVWLYIC